MSSEVEIAVQLAKLSAEVKQMTLIGDFIKIGFPSVVALASGAFAYKLHVKNLNTNIQIAENKNQHDIEIETLKINHEKEKEYDNHSFTLIQELADQVSTVHDAIVTYGHLISTYVINKSSTDISLVKRLKGNALAEYNSTHDIYTEHCNKIKSKSLLINNKSIIECEKIFNQTANNIYAECSINTKLNKDEILKVKIAFADATENLFAALSEHLSIRQN